MAKDRDRNIWLVVALGSGALALASIVLTSWLGLQPCHLCIFQRLLFILITLLALGAALAQGLARQVSNLLVFVAAGVGIATAAYQTWLQEQPPGAVTCLASEFSPIEWLVEWLGQLQPELFLATGFCEDKALVVLGLSLVQWALLSFVLVLVTTLWSWLRNSRGTGQHTRSLAKPARVSGEDVPPSDFPSH